MSEATGDGEDFALHSAGRKIVQSLCQLNIFSIESMKTRTFLVVAAVLGSGNQVSSREVRVSARED